VSDRGREGRNATLSPAPSTRRHIPALDGLRGLAIVLVFLHHIGWAIEQAVPGFDPGKLLLKSMWCGVDLFLVLSGFLITGILVDTRERKGYFRVFYARRTIRVFPLYFGVLALLFLVLRPVLSGRADYDRLVGEQWWFWLYLQNWRMGLWGWVDWEYVNHLWYVALDQQFYLVWPLVVYLTPRRHLLAVICVGAASGLAWRVGLSQTNVSDMACYLWTPCRVDSLLLGAALAVLVRSPSGIRAVLACRKWTLAASAAALAGWGLYAGWWNPMGPRFRVFGFSLLAVFFASVLSYCVLAERRSAIVKLLEARGLRWLGQISYGLYVVHFPVIAYLVRCFPGPEGAAGKLAAIGAFTIGAAPWSPSRWPTCPGASMRSRCWA